MKNLAIIPARGKSKRIPRKNIKNFLGRPIIAYSIETALGSNLFDEAMVSTDDEEIAQVGKRYGAKVPFMRSAKNSNDSATLSQVIEEVVNEYQKRGVVFENICCILPTAPSLTAKLLRKGYEMLLDEKLDSVRPIQRFSYPTQRAYKLKGKLVEYFHPEYEKVKSQDLEPSYHDAGMFYWIKTNSLKNNLRRGGIEISALEAHDIDSLDDWKMAELKYKALRGFRGKQSKQTGK